MQASDIPTKFSLKWGQNAPGADIRQVPMASQQGVQQGAASFNDGFPPVCFLPIASGGVPPFGQDFNGMGNMFSAWLQWQQAGAPLQYDAAFSTAIGGYPAGAMLQQAVAGPGNYWISTVDNNTTNPDSGGAGWTPWSVANARASCLGFEFGDGVNVIGASTEAWFRFPFACTITQVTLLADVSGTITIDFWKSNFAGYPPVVGNSITGGAPPALSSQLTYQNLTLTGWTKSISAGDILKAHVNASPSPASIKKILAAVDVLRA